MRSLTTTIILLTAAVLSAQGPVSLSLQQALDMAAKQSYAVQASALEAEGATASKIPSSAWLWRMPSPSISSA